MFELIVIFVCLTLNAMLAAYEIAFVSVPRPELRSLAKAGNKKASSLLKLRESPERTLSIVQIGITLVGAVAAAIGGAGAGENIEPYFMNTLGFDETSAEAMSIILVVVPITYLSVVLGEIVPKTLALRNPTKIVLFGAKALFLTDKILSPVVSALEWSTKQILKFFPLKPKKVSEAEEEGSINIERLSPTHQFLMWNLAGIEKKKIKDILLPWRYVTHIQKAASDEEVLSVIIKSGHTRLPVKDREQVIGFLHTKEFIALKESGITSWQSIIRSPLIVQADDSILAVLRLFQSQRYHMAIVMDAYGNHQGIVTLEDLLEEIVGDIFDEDDDNKIQKLYTRKSSLTPPER